MCPRNDGEFYAVDGLGATRSGFAELPCNPADFHHRHTARVLENGCHLQDDLQLVADGIGGADVEGLGTIAGLEQKGFASAERARSAVRLRASPAKISGGREPNSVNAVSRPLDQAIPVAAWPMISPGGWGPGRRHRQMVVDKRFKTN